MQIKWLRKALQNLNDEAEYIARDDPEAVKLVIQRIFNAVNLLSGNPALGHAGRIHGTRKLIVPNTRYVIPYRVKPQLENIEILRVFHASRRLPTQW